ncbi:hypothetical protein [Arthrobacter sp. VKM Ac-2550]|uniref:hypothetical protein n=1 Tax=Crystallibacter permensis TaxID=1938888 RepID=UPI002226C2C7|nr:hypothetical protein [Arthrobacter sp. VKM Ac-2550]MCW2134998.1 hypothetical protein [Arthrobacter sp. VKM Ac-2550]
MGFAIVMLVLVVAAIVWLVLSTRADRRPAAHVQLWQRSDWSSLGAYTLGPFGGHIDSSGNAGGDSGGGGGA